MPNTCGTIYHMPVTFRDLFYIFCIAGMEHGTPESWASDGWTLHERTNPNHSLNVNPGQPCFFFSLWQTPSVAWRLLPCADDSRPVIECLSCRMQIRINGIIQAVPALNVINPNTIPIHTSTFSHLCTVEIVSQMKVK